MEALFTFLFKYRPFYFAEGRLGFEPPLSPWILAAVLGVLLLAAAVVYRRIQPQGTRRYVLLAFRAALLLFLAALLLRPTLTLSRVVPQQGLVAVLVDNSRSMGIRDPDGVRGAPVADLVTPGSEFSRALEGNFQVRWMKFEAQAERLRDTAGLDWSGNQTNLKAALERVLAETRSLPLAGVVLMTDGADNSFRNPGRVVEEYAARRIPIHTVGVGPETPGRDVELVDVSLPPTVLPDSVAVARVTIRHPGFRGAQARVSVMDGATLVESQQVHLSRDSDLTTAELKIFPNVTGIRTYDFNVAPLSGEALTENNSRRTLLEVRDSKPRVLLVEGRPRWEYKFIRQALIEDRSIQLESLLRTAINKYYRQGIERETTLASGFPTSRDELFAYRGLILGDVEAGYFSYAQMEMIRDFVGQRGGGLLMLGGGSTLAAGGYENTPVEEALPVWLVSPDGRPDRSAGYLRGESRVEPTQYGANHPALQLVRLSEENLESWRRLPTIVDTNRVAGLKPGATVLAEHLSALGGADRGSPLLVSHRFGRGLGLAFMSGSSWRWQMLMDHTDQSHQTFWRQLLRWLVSSAGDAVSVEVERRVYAQNEPVRIRAEVNDRSFNRVNDARVSVEILGPDGSTESLALQWDSREDGVFVTEWVPRMDGLHRVRATAAAGVDEELGVAQAHFLTLTGQREFFDSTQKKDFLRGISLKTGGRHFDLSTAAQLPEAMMYSQSQGSVFEVLDLWDMPVNFLLLLGMMIGEWVTRKRWGLV